MKKYKFTDMKSMLKLLAFFCSILLSSLVNKTYSQTFTTPNNSFGTNSHRGAIDSTFYFPTGCGIPTDTTFLFSQGFGGKGEKKRMAAKYYDSCGHKEYTWDPSTQTWHQSDGGGGGGGTVTTANSVTGDGTGGTPVKLIGDATSPGNLKYYGTDISGTKGFGDLSALIKNIFNSDGKILGDRHLSMSGTHKFYLDSTFNFEINTGTTGAQITTFRVGNNAGTPEVELGDVQDVANKTRLIVDDPNSQVAIITQGVLKFRGNAPTANTVDLKTQLGAPEYTLYFPTSENFFQLDTLARLKDLRDLITASLGGGNPFADNNPLVKNNSDNTKKVTIGALNVTTSTTRTLQSPDANGTIVLNDNTATLTNKTVAAGSNTITGITNSNLSGSAAITNANLANSSITINGNNTALGTSVTVTDANLSTSNVITNNATTSKHGFVPILPNDATKYYDGTGAFSTPPGGSLAVSAAPNTADYTIPTGRRVFFTLADLTGQANHNVVLGATTAGDEIIITNLNTSASTFNWTFTGGTVKDFGQNTIATLTNLTVYHLVLISGSNYQIIN